MNVQKILNDTLEQAAKTPSREEAQRWLARVETLLDWMARHPGMAEVRCEAGRLLSDYRGTSPYVPARNRRV